MPRTISPSRQCLKPKLRLKLPPQGLVVREPIAWVRCGWFARSTPMPSHITDIDSMKGDGDCASNRKRIAIGVAPMGTIAIGIVPMGVISIGVVPMGYR